MHFVKPAWLTHGGDVHDTAVFSCHVSPDGQRLATAAGDGHVRVWSTEAVYRSTDPEFAHKPKQLCALSYHSGTIHAVRFSSNGKYLASGADDKIVCVYNLDPNPPTHTTFGSNESPPVENWRIYKRLIGHDNDVQDVGWSCDSSILVSVGLDSKVVVWSGSTFEKLKTLSHHQSHVKGITFDPANKYFATASDDRTIKIFRFTSPPPNATAHDQANNFVLEHTITSPFSASPLTTYFRRCSWSPEGNHIAAANSVNGPVSSVAIINRGAWNSDVHLIGHEGPVEVCAFSPRLFSKDPPNPNADPKTVANNTVTVIACAGQDKSLSVWNTMYPRPLTITHELAAKLISDLAWSPDGERLFMTSLDGSIMVVLFESGELGYPASMAENELKLAKFGAGRKAGVPEGPDALMLEESSKAGEQKAVQGRMGELMGGDDAHPTLAITNGVNGAAHTNGTNGTTSIKDTEVAVVQSAPDLRAQKIEQLKSRVTYTKDGKKRIAPILVSGAGSAESSLPNTQLIASTTQAARTDAPQTVLDLSKPYDGLPKGGITAMLFGNKRKFAEIDGVEGSDRAMRDKVSAAVKNGAAPIVLNTADGLVPPKAPPAKEETIVPEVLRPAIVNPSLALSTIRLAAPMVRSVVVRPLTWSTDKDKENEDAITLEARNASGRSRTGRVQDKDPARITVMKKGQLLWQDFVPQAVLLVTANTNFWAAACEDGSIYIWTPAGRRLLNALILEAQPVIFDCRGWWLMCITAVGMCHVWNIKTLSSPHPPVSLAPVLDIAVHSQGPHLTTAPGIIFARLNTKGRIIIGMSNGDGYAYAPAMYTWQRLSEQWWAVGSQYWNTVDQSVSSLQSTGDQVKDTEDDDEVRPENISAGIIPHLERNTTSQVLLRGRAYFLQRLIKQLLSAEGFEGFESSVSIGHLENRVAAAMMLGAREEFRVYLLMYTKRLGAEGLKGKIEELLRSIMGNTIFEAEDVLQKGKKKDEGKGWQSDEEELCGWKREDLLKEVVLILGKHRDLQRITVPYAQLLGIVGEHSAAGTAGEDRMET